MILKVERTYTREYRVRLINKKHPFSIMDTATAEKINKLAKSMKELHLSATMEEAYERAKEIILGSVQLEKSAKEVVKDAGLAQECGEESQEEKVILETKEEKPV